MKNSWIGTALFTLGMSTPALSDIVQADDVIVTGNICVGASNCVDGEVFGNVDLKIRSTNAEIAFIDSSVSGSNDWSIKADDDTAGATDSFSISNQSTGAIPFAIAPQAPSASVFIDSTGDVGIGTVLPQKPLHVAAPFTPTIRLERTTGATPFRWDILADNSGIAIRDDTTGTAPLIIQDGTPTLSFYMVDTGDVGLGTQTPDGKLHTAGDGVQLVYFESEDGGPVQVRFRTDSENRRFLATNNADEVQSQIIFGDDEIKFTGATDSGANLWLSISAAGIVSQGPTCNPGPCDATFDPAAFDVPSIEEHAAYMWENQHLWAVGPTTADQPFNLTQKAGGMLHELEVAHIYIEQLHSQLEDQQSQLADQAARLERLEAALSE